MKGRIEVYNSVGGATFFEGLVREWQQTGWQVDCVHAMREQEYRRKTGRMGHLAKRWRMYGGFALTCWRQARAGRAAGPLRVVTTNPFFAPALVQWSASGRGATINLVYDLFPDALAHAGIMRRDSPLARACALLTRRALRDCTVSVFLGERLLRHAELWYGPARRAMVIPVGADGGPFRGHEPQALAAGGEVVLLYAGQMGRMHDIDTLRGALIAGLPRSVRLRIHASGAGYVRLRRETSDAVCEWGAPLAEDAWRSAMLEAHVALVTMSPGAENIVMPSKTYSALVAGQAVLAVCPRGSDLADLIMEHDCGWIVEPGDVDGLRRVLYEISISRDELQRKRMNAFSAGHTHYDVTMLAKQWIQLFESLTES